MNDHVRIVAGSVTTSKGQTTIPKLIRDEMGIKEGTPLNWVFEDGTLRVSAKTRRLEDFVGILGKPPNGAHVSIEEMNEGIGRAVAERFRRKLAP